MQYLGPGKDRFLRKLDMLSGQRDLIKLVVSVYPACRFEKDRIIIKDRFFGEVKLT